MKKHAKTVVYFLIIVAILVFLFEKRESFKIFLQIDPLKLTLLIAFHIIPFYILGLIFRQNVLLFNLRLNFTEWFGITIGNSMFNYMLPFWAGAATRAMYMKKKYDFAYSNYVSYLSGFYLLNFSVSSFIAVVSGSYLIAAAYLDPPFFYVLIGVFLSLSSALYVFYKYEIEKYTFKKTGKVYRIINNCISGIKHYKENPRQLLLLVSLLFAFTLIMGIRLFFAYSVLGFKVHVVPLIFVQSIVSFSRLLAFTPGNIGVREGIIGLSASLMGLNFDDALLGAILDRLVAMFIVFILGLIFSKILLAKIPTSDSIR